MSFPPPQKRLGQHFLIDPNIVGKILSVAALDRSETVLEIGPGRGILTRALCEHAGHVIAVELDARLRAPLEEALANCAGLDLRFDDALKFPYESLPPGTVVVANLPYYLSSPLLFKLLAVRDRLSRMVLMLQAEVADRLIAAPRTRDYGILSVVAAYYAELRIGFRVSRNCFRPRPEVGSAVVTLRPRSEAPIHVMDEAAFIKTVRAAFAHRRKTIANSLRDEGFDPDLIVDALGEVHLDPSRRAETLSLADFAGLANVLTGRNAFAV